MKKQASAEVVRGRLLQGGFGRPAADLPPPSDPDTRIQMDLSVEQIKLYDRNPRRSPNPKYAEIKESIRATRGMGVHFTVTRRPGEELYMVEESPVGGQRGSCCACGDWRSAMKPSSWIS